MVAGKGRVPKVREVSSEIKDINIYKSIEKLWQLYTSIRISLFLTYSKFTSALEKRSLENDQQRRSQIKIILNGFLVCRFEWKNKWCQISAISDTIWKVIVKSDNRKYSISYRLYVSVKLTIKNMFVPRIALQRRNCVNCWSNSLQTFYNNFNNNHEL